MSRIKRMLGAAVVGALAAAVLAVPAQASNVSGKCVVDGGAKVVDKADPTQGVLLVGGEGSYTFRGLNLTCTGTEKGNPVVVEFDVESQGKYTNAVCGTGTAWSDRAPVLVPGSFRYVVGSGKGESFYAAVLSNVRYKVVFTASGGTFHANNDPSGVPVKDVPKPTDPGNPIEPDPTKGDPPDNLVVAGAVNLSPPHAADKAPTVPTPPTCTKAFHVTGTIDINQDTTL